MNRREEVSAGGVVYRRNGRGKAEVVLGSRRTRTGDLAWGLPKGQIDEGETIPETALREVREETGIVAEVDSSLGSIDYFYVWDGRRIHKVVHFFLMRATGGDVSDHDDELEDVEWVPIEEALARASYPSEGEVLERAAEVLG